MPLRQHFPMLRAAQRTESPKLFCRDISKGNSKDVAEYVLIPELALQCTEQQIRLCGPLL